MTIPEFLIWFAAWCFSLFVILLEPDYIYTCFVFSLMLYPLFIWAFQKYLYKYGIEYLGILYFGLLASSLFSIFGIFLTVYLFDYKNFRPFKKFMSFLMKRSIQDEILRTI